MAESEGEENLDAKPPPPEPVVRCAIACRTHLLNSLSLTPLPKLRERSSKRLHRDRLTAPRSGKRILPRKRKRLVYFVFHSGIH